MTNNLYIIALKNYQTDNDCIIVHNNVDKVMNQAKDSLIHALGVTDVFDTCDRNW